MGKTIPQLLELEALDIDDLDLVPVQDVSENKTRSVSIDQLREVLFGSIETLLGKVYPLGSIYANADDSRNPSEILGFGTWEPYAVGRVRVGIDTSQTEFDTRGKTGGHKLMQAHTHTGNTSTNGDHTHAYSVPYQTQLTHYGTYARVAWEGYQELGRGTGGGGNHSHSFTTASTGGGDAQNLQPYVVEMAWKRIA